MITHKRNSISSIKRYIYRFLTQENKIKIQNEVQSQVIVILISFEVHEYNYTIQINHHKASFSNIC